MTGLRAPCPAAALPSIFTFSTPIYLLIPGCLLALVLAGVMLQGYRQTRVPTLLYAGLGLAVSAALALALGTYFALVPGFAVALLLYLRAE